MNVNKSDKDAAFARLARAEAELLDRLRGRDLELLNDLIEAWTEYCDVIEGL